MERFLAICHPLHLYTMSGLQRAVRIIAALWVISFLSAVPFAVFTKIHYLPYPPSKYVWVIRESFKILQIFKNLIRLKKIWRNQKNLREKLNFHLLNFSHISLQISSQFSSQWNDPWLCILCDVGQSKRISTVGSFNLCVLCIPHGYHDYSLRSDGTENQVEDSTKCSIRWVYFYLVSGIN